MLGKNLTGVQFENECFKWGVVRDWMLVRKKIGCISASLNFSKYDIYFIYWPQKNLNFDVSLEKGAPWRNVMTEKNGDSFGVGQMVHRIKSSKVSRSLEFQGGRTKPTSMH